MSGWDQWRDMSSRIRDEDESPFTPCGAFKGPNPALNANRSDNPCRWWPAQCRCDEYLEAAERSDSEMHIAADGFARERDRLEDVNRALRDDVEQLRGPLSKYETDSLLDAFDKQQTKVERLLAALTEITELDLEGDASVNDAIVIADEALHPPPLGNAKAFTLEPTSEPVDLPKGVPGTFEGIYDRDS